LEIVLRHCERSEAIQGSIGLLWIAASFLAMTKDYFGGAALGKKGIDPNMLYTVFMRF